MPTTQSKLSTVSEFRAIPMDQHMRGSKSLVKFTQIPSYKWRD